MSMESPHVTSYESLIVTVAVSATVFEIFSLKDRKLILPTQGRRHGFKGGGGQFRERSERKNFFDPPTLRLPGGYRNKYGCSSRS